MTCEEGQDWCNFVVMRPTLLPADMTIYEETLRPEAPPGVRPNAAGRFEHGISNRASFRSLMIGNTRAARVKQFLYDFGPPAWDHPIFWLSDSVSGVPVGDNIGWIGLDANGRPTASASIDRTLIEVSVCEGTLTEEELLMILHGLRPVAEGPRDVILQTPFSVLSYQRRHIDPLITVPMGYWKHRRQPAYLPTIPLTAGEQLPAGRIREIKPPPRNEYRLDSVFIYGDAENPQEIEYIYERGGRPGEYVRILVWKNESAGCLIYPPLPDRQPCSRDTFFINGVLVYHAFRDQRYGQHEAVWRDADFTYMLLAKPTRWTTTDWFRALLESTI